MKVRLDHLLVQRGLVATRSQAESYIRLGKVTVADKIITKPGYFVDPTAAIELLQDEQYVSR
ncbi:MAG TPA: S4 domain-containing protein, partial [Candidatus Nanoperiomorbaceae bacterium]|nr:S4 domain-containing protein [Candidatus Nanoperiomorbaceae bacterium]HMQ97190.1 S4 domain-containing protein [Candidatus Nanoperiomorbaceae bacterium]